MKFRTELTPHKSVFSIDYSAYMLGIGSCFTENIGHKLTERQFQYHNNPFGIVYNPLSMAAQLDVLLSDKTYTQADLFTDNNLFHSWLHHGKYSGYDENNVLDKINIALAEARVFLKKTNILMLTFGSASVYGLKTDGQIVANCHKVPPQYFERRRLTVEEIVTKYSHIIHKINAQLPDIHVIITISPIRHLRDGLIENNRSKAVLLLAATELSHIFENIIYFPAYELVIDDLRDYRFFEPDMMHPTPQAIDYIWYFFKETFFDDTTKNTLKEIEKKNTRLAHRPIYQ